MFSKPIVFGVNRFQIKKHLFVMMLPMGCYTVYNISNCSTNIHNINWLLTFLKLKPGPPSHTVPLVESMSHPLAVN